MTLFSFPTGRLFSNFWKRILTFFLILHQYYFNPYSFYANVSATYEMTSTQLGHLKVNCLLLKFNHKLRKCSTWELNRQHSDLMWDVLTIWHVRTIWDVLTNEVILSLCPVEGRRPEGEGTNLVRSLIPYHGKCKANPISHRFYIYIYIYLLNGCPHARYKEIWPW